MSRPRVITPRPAILHLFPCLSGCLSLCLSLCCPRACVYAVSGQFHGKPQSSCQIRWAVEPPPIKLPPPSKPVATSNIATTINTITVTLLQLTTLPIQPNGPLPTIQCLLGSCTRWHARSVRTSRMKKKIPKTTVRSQKANKDLHEAAKPLKSCLSEESTLKSIRGNTLDIPVHHLMCI